MDARIQCKLMVTGNPDDVRNFKEEMKGEYPSYEIGHGCPSCRVELEPQESEEHSLCFNNVVSVPEDKLKKGYPKAGMYWEINNWGVKWGAVDDRIVAENDTSITYRFWTPAVPPRKWVKAASESFKNLRFTLAYFGEECFPFWGVEVFSGGEKIWEAEIPREEGEARLNEEWNRVAEGLLVDQE